MNSIELIKHIELKSSWVEVNVGLHFMSVKYTNYTLGEKVKYLDNDAGKTEYLHVHIHVYMCVCAQRYKYNLMSLFLFVRVYGFKADYSVLDNQLRCSSLGEANSPSPHSY